MSDIAEHHRRTIELERENAFREAVDACIAKLISHDVRAETYRKAFKRAISLLKELKT